MNKRKRTKYTVLGMLTIEPMSGYEIRQTIKTSTAFFWSESEGQIYPALTECVETGLATCREKISKDNRIKKIYTITKKGRKALSDWLAEEVQPSTIRNELLLKLFFGNNISEEENLLHIKNQEKKLKKHLKMLEGLYHQLSVDEKNSPHLKYWLITIDYGIKIVKAKLKWCQDSMKLFTDKKRK